MAMPPLWSLRAPSMQHDALLDFVLPVVGAASWMGSRDSRRGTGDLTAIVARPLWIRQLTAWAAVTAWALAGYVACVGVLYAVTAGQASWGGPLWWPALVGGRPAVVAAGASPSARRPPRSALAGRQAGVLAGTRARPASPMPVKAAIRCRSEGASRPCAA